MAAEKAEGLDDRHQRERYADRRGSAGSDPGDEERVRHVVNGRNQHSDDGRNGHFADERLDRRLGHLDEFLFLCVGCQAERPFRAKISDI